MGDAAGLLSGGDTPPTLRLHVAVRAVRLSTVVGPSANLATCTWRGGAARASENRQVHPNRARLLCVRARRWSHLGHKTGPRDPIFCGWKGEKGNTINGT